MYKIADDTKDNSTIVPVTENFEPVEIVTQPVAKNLLNFKTLKNVTGLTIDDKNLALTTDGSTTLYSCAWGDGSSVVNKQLKHSITMKCRVRILEDCVVSSAVPFRISIHNVTKNRTLALIGLNSVSSGTKYTAGQELNWTRTNSATANYTDGDEIRLYVYTPARLKAKFSNIMISLEDVPYEPYPPCEVLFAPEAVTAEGTEIAVNNTFRDSLEAEFYGKTELKFDVAQCEGATSQVVHERDSYNILDISDAAVSVSRAGLLFEAQEDGGYHVWGTTTGGPTAWVQLSFSKKTVIPAGTYYGCGKNNMSITAERKISEAPGYKLYSFHPNGKATVIEEDTEVTRMFFQWGGGVDVDEIVYPYIGTQFVTEYEPFFKKTPTLQNPSPVTPLAEGGYNVLKVGDVEATGGLSYELQEDGGYHVWGTTTAPYAQIVFAKNYTLKSGQYYGCAINNRTIYMLRVVNGVSQYPGVYANGNACMLDSDTTFTRIYAQWNDSGTVVDEVVYPFIGTQYATEYIHYNDDRGKYQLNHSGKKYEIQLPCDLHGFEQNDTSYRNVLKIDFLHKRFNLQKKVESYVVPIDTAISTSAWESNMRRFSIAAKPAKKTGNNTIGNCSFAKVMGSHEGNNSNRDHICPHHDNPVLYWYPDFSVFDIPSDADLETTNSYISQYLSKLSDKERTVTYALAEEVVYHDEIIEVESSTLPELPLESFEITEQSCEYPVVLEATQGTIITGGKNLFDISKVASKSLLNGNTLVTHGGTAHTILANAEAMKVFPLGKEVFVKFHAKIVDVPVGAVFDTVKNLGFQVYHAPSKQNIGSFQIRVEPEDILAGCEFEFCGSTVVQKNAYANGDTVAMWLHVPGDPGQKLYCKVEISNIMISTENVPYEPYIPGTSAALPPMHGLIQRAYATEYDYIDNMGNKVKSDYVMKTREKVDGVFVDRVLKTQKYKIVEFDGGEDEAWRYGVDKKFFSLTLKDAVRAGVDREELFVCTHSKYGGYGGTIWENVNTKYGFCGNMASANFRNLDIADLDEWRAFLAAQASAGTPVQILYELAEPVVEDITDTAEGQAILQLKTIPYHTRIYSDCDYHIKAKMRVWKDSKS